jgi:hypothetical protein
MSSPREGTLSPAFLAIVCFHNSFEKEGASGRCCGGLFESSNAHSRCETSSVPEMP